MANLNRTKAVLDEETLFYKLISWMDNLYQEIKD